MLTWASHTCLFVDIHFSYFFGQNSSIFAGHKVGVYLALSESVNIFQISVLISWGPYYKERSLGSILDLLNQNMLGRNVRNLCI
jgi:hypothetical protein